MSALGERATNKKQERALQPSPCHAERKQGAARQQREARDPVVPAPAQHREPGTEAGERQPDQRDHDACHQKNDAAPLHVAILPTSNGHPLARVAATSRRPITSS
jgi:hypothetical protein